MSDLTNALIAAAVVVVLAALRAAGAPKKTTSRKGSRASFSRSRAGYPGDFTGSVAVSYSPSINGKPDPGEIVWTWVPFEEDSTHGKDRPVLLIGRDADYLLGVMLTSKNHDRDAAYEARWGRYWIDLGSGEWDPKRRPSEVRLDRIVRVDPRRMRREGAILDRTRFDAVARSLTKINGW